jgi:hypothetical protein
VVLTDDKRWRWAADSGRQRWRTATALVAHRGWVPEREGGGMEVGIRRNGGRSGMSAFYRARATWRFEGGEVVRRSIAMDISMYPLREWMRAGRRGNGGAGHCEKGKRRR